VSVQNVNRRGARDALGKLSNRNDAIPARIISVYGPRADSTMRGPRSSIRPSDASTKNAGDPKYNMNPALLIRRR
jgi:hypothetical protein